MSNVQRVTTTAAALVITLVGATLVTAPMSLPASQQAVVHAQQWSTGHFHRIATDLRYAAASARV